jgi:hypothetical protein
MSCGLSCYGTRENSPVCKFAGGEYVSIRERVILAPGGQLATGSPSARSMVKTSSILLFVKRFDSRPTLTKSVHICTIATQQICRILDYRLVELS